VGNGGGSGGCGGIGGGGGSLGPGSCGLGPGGSVGPGLGGVGFEGGDFGTAIECSAIPQNYGGLQTQTAVLECSLNHHLSFDAFLRASFASPTAS
jgi:hypothetical protein